MSSFDTIENIIYQIKRYILPVAFLTIGLVLLKMALVPVEVVLNNDEVLAVEQNSSFLYASLVFIGVSVVWLLYLFDMIKSIVSYALIAIMLVGSAVILYFDYVTVKEEVVFNKKYNERELEMKVRIMDIKAAEVAYREVNGVFTDDFEDLVNFINTGTKMDFIKNGGLPERKITVEERDLIYADNRPIDKLMNEVEATHLARLNNGLLDGKKFQRDTIFVSVLEAIFESDRFLTTRAKMDGNIEFHPDSLMYVPFTRELVELDTASVLKSDLKVPTLLIKMTHPMEHPTLGYKELTVGAIDDNHLRDNWSK